MLKCFFAAKPWALWAWGGLALMLGAIWTEVQIQVRLNEWYGDIYNMLQRAPDMPLIIPFASQIWIFVGLAFPFILIRVFSNFFAQHYAFRWRQAITFSYLPKWNGVAHEIEGASQRIQEDAQRFARQTEILGLGLFRAVLTLIAFIPVLAAISAGIAAAYEQTIPGVREELASLSGPAQAVIRPWLWGIDWVATTPNSLVWVAFLGPVAGTIISWFVGIKLPGLEYNNQRVEAAFRKRLVYAEDDKNFADMPSLLELFTGIRRNYFRLFLHYSYFGLWENFFFQVLIIIDFILLGPAVLAGIITLGVLTQVSHAFGKVSESFAYLINRWTDITELRSIYKRLREFEQNIGMRAGGGGAAAAPKAQIVKPG